MDSDTREYLRSMSNETVKTKTIASVLEECQCADCVAKRRKQSYQPLPSQEQTTERRSIIRNPDNFYPELSPDYEFVLSGKKYKYSR